MANSSYLELESLQTKIDSFHNALIDRLKKTRYYLVDDEEQTVNTDWQSFGPSDSPLSNPYILENIASHLPIQDMRNCVLVCRVWNTEIKRCLNKRKKLYVTPDETTEAEQLLKTWEEGNAVNLATLCHFRILYTNLLGTKLLTCFGSTLGGLKLEECDINATNLYHILHCLAPNLEVLCVSQRVPQVEGGLLNPNAPQLIVHPIIRVSTFAQIRLINSNFRLPKLKKLQWYERGGQVGLQEIIQCCPNLVELDYENCPNPTDPLIFQDLCGSWDSLRQLCLSPTEELRGQYFDVLTMLKLKVTKVTLYQLHPGGRKRMEKLKTFLKSISNSLEDLFLYQHSSTDRTFYEPNYASPFPVKLPKLVNLISEPGLITSINMLSSIPNLRRFRCKFRQSEDWTSVLNKKLPPPQINIKDVNLGSVDNFVLEKISAIFPNVTHLELNASKVDDNAFRTLIKGFPNLKHLKIFKCRSAAGLLLTDSGITGIPEENCKALTEYDSYKNLDVSSLRKFPYIGDLPTLYGVEFETISSNLTDLSTCLGFKDLKELRFLSLPNSQVSDITLETITTHLPYLLILGVQNCSKISQPELNKLQSARPELMINVFSILNDLGDVFSDEPNM